MAESVVANNIDDQEIINITHTQQQDEEENIEKSANSEEANDSSTDLAGINLVMIVSLLSLSAEECQNLDQQEEETDQSNHKKKKKKQTSSLPSTSRSDFLIRKREINDFRASERQTTKVHAKIRDCRHSRRL